MHIDPQQLVQKLLHKKFSALKKSNPKFSLRAFASKLKVSPSSLSEILNGRRAVSFHRAHFFANTLNLDEEQKNWLRLAFENDQQISKLNKFSRNHKSQEVWTKTQEEFLLVDWIYMALLGVLRLKKNPQTVLELSQLLQLSEKKVLSALLKLEKNDLITRTSEGHFIDKNKTFLSSPDHPKDIFRKRIKQSLVGMRNALKEDAKNSWESYFSIISTNENRIQESLPIIEDFLRRLSLFLSQTDDKNQLFELNINLFPRTNRPKKLNPKDENQLIGKNLI